MAAQALSQTDGGGSADGGTDGGSASCSVGATCTSAANCPCGKPMDCVNGACCGASGFVLVSGLTQTACCSGQYNAEFGIAVCTAEDAGAGSTGGSSGGTPESTGEGTSSGAPGPTTADAGSSSSGGGCGFGPAASGPEALVLLGLGAFVWRRRKRVPG